MRRSKTEIYLHLVWTTRNRERWLVDDVREQVYASIRSEAFDLGCSPLAIGGVEDHVHLLLRITGQLSAAGVMKQLKGSSSRSVNRQLPDGESFRWQEGYGAFSVTRSHLRRVTEYIETQEERHAEDRLWPEWEETDVERPLGD